MNLSGLSVTSLLRHLVHFFPVFNVLIGYFGSAKDFGTSNQSQFFSVAIFRFSLGASFSS